MAYHELIDSTFNYNGISIKWTSFGSGPPVVFLHGTPWSSQLWLPIARCFARSFTVYLYDLPGYGQSVIPLDKETSFSPTYPEQTKAFCALLDHWGASRDEQSFHPHVVAHDIGGAIALRAILLEERFFSSLALVDCGASYPVDEAFFSLVRENTSVFISLPSNLHEALLREYLRRASFNGLRKDQEDMLVAPWITADGQRAFYTQINAQRNEDIKELMEHYRTLDTPVHIIWALNDTWVPVERAYILQKAIGGTLKVIEHAGHLVHLDAPEELTLELSEWLRSRS
ncbi:alpha/beta hydrolase fold-containing protein [Rhizodiscina lignyota]|uniref:Alpha/beta hydrolase fold-containing protein n=1 Tax=Rhizodiscina lignyota TaxID=1504668 RepID=A0A9P4I895_9PEZI|nr:alpha/beta hydrolase fold-containing protein [Rhizodiscina lignyota]